MLSARGFLLAAQVELAAGTAQGQRRGLPVRIDLEGHIHPLTAAAGSQAFRRGGAGLAATEAVDGPDRKDGDGRRHHEGRASKHRRAQVGDE